ncbi:MAG: hypothetical protein M3Y08_21080 [Fibrobacterota bacterium]|nr:hypothetical protein [Fibrobacterota bacterium]
MANTKAIIAYLLTLVAFALAAWFILSWDGDRATPLAGSIASGGTKRLAEGRNTGSE